MLEQRKRRGTNQVSKKKNSKGPRELFSRAAICYYYLLLLLLLLLILLLLLHTHMHMHIQQTRAHVTLRGWHLAPTRGVVDWHYYSDHDDHITQTRAH